MASVIDDIKGRLDIVELVQSYIRLNKAGVNYKANCPFHSEKTPSFVVSPTRQIWHCFGCGLGGDHMKFVMQIEALEFPDALELLAKRAGVQLRREDPRMRSERTRLYLVSEEAAKLFEAVLHSSKNPEVRVSPPLIYLKKRGLADETIKDFRLGYAPDSWDFAVRALRQKGFKPEEIEKAGLAIRSEQGSFYDRFRNRIVFPIHDFSGRVVGFSGRIFASPSEAPASEGANPAPAKAATTGAKYINTPQTAIYDKSRVLYGFDKAKEAIRRENAVVLVEGQMDVVLSHQAGVKNTVAVSGTALSVQQLKTLERLSNTIISSFDRDQAGEAATKRSLDLASQLGFERKVAILPQGMKDPADAVLQNPEIWKAAVAEAKPIVQFFLDSALGRHDRKSGSGKRLIAGEVLPEIRIITSEVEKAHWVQTLAREISIEEDALWRELKKARGVSAEAAPAKADSRVDRNRRHQLESLLLGTLILHPEERDKLPSLPKEFFLQEKHLQILNIIETSLRENIKEHDRLLAAIPPEFRETCNYLAFQAEVILERIDNSAERAQEILVCLKELEREWARERLRALTREISQAEKEGNQTRLSTLLVEFNDTSQKIQ